MTEKEKETRRASYEVGDDDHTLFAGLASEISPSRIELGEKRLEDDLQVMRAEQIVEGNAENNKERMSRSRSRRGGDTTDDFEELANNRFHVKQFNAGRDTAGKWASVIRRVHGSNWLFRYFTYIMPVFLALLIPLLLGRLAFPDATVGGVSLLWFSIWLEIIWLTLWASRIISKIFPSVALVIASVFSNNNKMWRDLFRMIEFAVTGFFWALAVYISCLPTLTNHHLGIDNSVQAWESILNKILLVIFIAAVLNLAEKILIQLIAVNFHSKTYDDRIALNKFQITCLTKLYQYVREQVGEFEDERQERITPHSAAARTPRAVMDDAVKQITFASRSAAQKTMAAMGKVAGDLAGRRAKSSTEPRQIVLQLINSDNSARTLARRIYQTLIKDGNEALFPSDFGPIFQEGEEADAAFQTFDKDSNGDANLEEIQMACIDVGKERRAITSSLKDLDSAVGKLDVILSFVVFTISVVILISIVITSAAAALTSAGTIFLGLSWVLGGTAQEFLAAVVFVFVKHPFDIGDRVDILVNGVVESLTVREISLMSCEFRRMDGKILQAPNSLLNTVYIYNMRRSGTIAEGVPVLFRVGTTIEQIELLRLRMLTYVMDEKRDYVPNCITEVKDFQNSQPLVSVIFFYKTNFQNEGLRLSRRTRFISALIMTLNDLGLCATTPGYMATQPQFISQLPAVSVEKSPISTSNDKRSTSERLQQALGQRDIEQTQALVDDMDETARKRQIPEASLAMIQEQDDWYERDENDNKPEDVSLRRKESRASTARSEISQRNRFLRFPLSLRRTSRSTNDKDVESASFMRP